MNFSDQLRRLRMESYSLRNMYLVIIVVCLEYFIAGATLVWTSPMIISLSPLTTIQKAMITSCCPLGMCMGPVLALPLIQRLGQKSIMWLTLALYFASLVFLSIPLNVPGICIGRIIGGIAIGLVTFHMPEYMTEMCEPEVLDVMKPISSAAPCLGYLLVYSLGIFLDYYQLLFVFLFGYLLLLVCQLWVPPSPIYCVSKGKIEQAKQVIACLKRGISTSAVETEIKNIQNKIAMVEPLPVKEVLGFLPEPATKHALLLSVGLGALTQFSGATTLLAVLQPALLSVQGQGSSAHLCISVSVLIAGVVNPMLTVRYGSKKPLIAASAVMSCSMLIFGLYLLNLDSKMKIWVLPIWLMVYFIAFQLGFANNKEAIIRKLYNTRIKQYGLAYTTTVEASFAFVAAFIFFPLGVSAVVWIYALSSFLAVVYVSLFIPETSKMTETDVHKFLIAEESLGASLYKLISCR